KVNVPALFTSTSIRLKRRRTVPTSRRTSPGLVTSALTPRPRPGIDAAARSRAFRPRATSTRVAPSRARRCAIARPIPRLAPVTTTTLPLSLDMRIRRKPRGAPKSVFLVDQPQELCTRLVAIPEDTQHRRGHGNRILFFHPAHNHAEVTCLDDNPNSLGLDLLHDGFRNLSGETLLHLKAAGKHVHQARELAEANHLVGGHISHVAAAEKGQQVVFTHAEHSDILYNHQ